MIPASTGDMNRKAQEWSAWGSNTMRWPLLSYSSIESSVDKHTKMAKHEIGIKAPNPQ